MTVFVADVVFQESAEIIGVFSSLDKAKEVVLSKAKEALVKEKFVFGAYGVTSWEVDGAKGSYWSLEWGSDNFWEDIEDKTFWWNKPFNLTQKSNSKEDKT